jgi:hypothetical protein
MYTIKHFILILSYKFIIFATLIFRAVPGLSDGLSANYYKFLNEAISKAKTHFDG